MKKLLLLAFISICSTGFGQSTPFQNTYSIPSNTGATDPTCILQLPDSGYFVVVSYGVLTLQDVWLMRLDKNGNHIWTKRYDGTIATRGGRIHPAGNNEYFLIAAPSVIKIDSAGNMLWNQRYYNGGTWWLSTPTETGGLVLAGATGWSASGWGGEIQLIKIDGSGNIIWSRWTDQGNKDLNDIITVPDDDGEYYVISGQHEFGDQITCVDENGVTVWSNYYSTMYADLAVSPDSCIYMCHGHPDSLGVTYGFRFYKIGINGSPIFSRSFTTTVSNGYIMYQRIETRDTLIQLVGVNTDSLTIVHLMLDTSLNILWQAEISIPGHTMNTSPSNMPLPDGGSILCMSAQDASSNPYLLIHRTDNTGMTGCNDHTLPIYVENRGCPVFPMIQQGNFTPNITPDTTLASYAAVNTIPNCAVSNKDITNEEPSFAFFPNPSAGTFTINSSSATPYTSVRIIDLLGQQVLATRMDGVNTVIDCSTLPDGCYQIFLNDVPTAEKLIISK